MKKLLLLLFLLPLVSKSQNPTVVGDTILCPHGTGLVSTQPYDTYQWFLRYFGSSSIIPISGATGQSLMLDFSTYAASYVSVEVTIGSNDYISPEFFVDGYAFAGFTVASTGHFTIGSMGESIICPGDTMFFEVLQPYDTNITWYLDGDTIPGMNNPILTVTVPGTYFVTGAPSVCPLFIENPGVDLSVVDCFVGIDDPLMSISISAYPNPTTGIISIMNSIENSQYKLIDCLGKTILKGNFLNKALKLDLSFLESGIYFLKTDSGSLKIIRE